MDVAYFDGQVVLIDGKKAVKSEMGMHKILNKLEVYDIAEGTLVEFFPCTLGENGLGAIGIKEKGKEY